MPILLRWCMGLAVIVPCLAAVTAWGATPLLTDDAVTLGTGNGQFEVCGRWGTDRDRSGGVTTKSTVSQVTTALTYGVADPVDMVFEFARDWGEVKSQGVTSTDPDTVGFKLSAKLRLFEAGNFSLAVRPDLGYSYVPAGSSHDAVYTYGGVVIATHKLEPFTVHLNLGGLYNDYQASADRDASRSVIWSGSLAAIWQVASSVQLVADIGVSTNPDKATTQMPAFSCAGLIYSITEQLDLAGGFKFGLNKPETDLTLQSALVFKF